MPIDASPIEPPRPRDVDTSVATDLRPEMIAEHVEALGKDPATAPAMRAANLAMTKMAASAAAMSAAAQELKHGGEQRINAAGITFAITGDKVQAMADAAGHSFARGAELQEAAMLEIDNASKAVALGIETALKDPRANETARAAVATEIRMHIKAIPEEKRMGWAMNALEAGDVEIVRAILQGGPFASGLDRKAFALFRSEAEKGLAPELVVKRDHLNVARGKVERAGSTFLKHYIDVVPKSDGKQDRKAAALKNLREAV